jgi:hypothetical protein
MSEHFINAWKINSLSSAKTSFPLAFDSLLAPSAWSSRSTFGNDPPSPPFASLSAEKVSPSAVSLEIQLKCIDMSVARIVPKSSCRKSVHLETMADRRALSSADGSWTLGSRERGEASDGEAGVAEGGAVWVRSMDLDGSAPKRKSSPCFRKRETTRRQC